MDKPPIVVPRTTEPPPVPPTMLVGLGVVLTIAGWWLLFIAFLAAPLMPFAWAALAGAVVAFARGFGDRYDVWWRVWFAVLAVIAGAFVLRFVWTGTFV